MERLCKVSRRPHVPTVHLLGYSWSPGLDQGCHSGLQKWLGCATTTTGPTHKGRAATKAKPALVNAVHAFYLGEDVDTEHPDHYITQHSSTGADTPHYMHSTRLWTCAMRVERGSRTVVFPVTN